MERAAIDAAPIRTLPKADALISLFNAETEGEGWRIAMSIGLEQFNVDAVVGVELLDDITAVILESTGLDGFGRSDPFPFAPESQLGYISRSSEMVSSPDILNDPRFVAGKILERAGVRSSMSWRFDLPDGRVGVIGAHSREIGAFGPADIETFKSWVALTGTALAHLRVRDRLRHAAHYDPLTGVLNRSSIMETLSDRLRSGGDVAALLIDFDGFKSVNDDHGHAVGDVALNGLARRIERCIAPADSVGRLGGDEFLAVISDSSTANMVAERIISHVEDALLVGRSLVQLSASIGIATRSMGDDVASMIDRADRLMYSAKSAGRGQTRVENSPVEQLSPLIEALPVMRPSPKQAVDDAIDGLRIVFQPIVEAATGLVYGYEALTRGPVGHELETPNALFPAAAMHGCLGELEVEAKRQAMLEWPSSDVPLFVNLEPELLCDAMWGPRLLDVIDENSGGRPVIAEVTERAVLQSPGRLLRAVEACRRRGWKVALDDVGSRSDSLAVLRCVHPDVVKLDMGLIEADRYTHAANVAAAVSAYREKHDALVVAEGVENREQLAHARVLGADLVQGFMFGRPAERDNWTDYPSIHPATTINQIRRPGARTANTRDMMHLSRHVESVVFSPDCILLASVQHANNYTERTRRQYSAIARRCGMVGVVGAGMTQRFGSTDNGVRIADIDVGDDLLKQWNVVLLSPSKSLALLAEEVTPHGEGCRDKPAEEDRRFTFRLVTDGDTVEDAASSILRYF